tara:strand:+ start:283 stop:534 length:252 start_codon:yes stop_codon:yes gene_type:complete
MMLGMTLALGLVAAVLLAVYWGKKAGEDSARASDLVSIRDKNAKINEDFSKMREKHGEELDSIDSADAARKLRELGRRRGKDS